MFVFWMLALIEPLDHPAQHLRRILRTGHQIGVRVTGVLVRLIMCNPRRDGGSEGFLSGFIGMPAVAVHIEPHHVRKPHDGSQELPRLRIGHEIAPLTWRQRVERIFAEGPFKALANFLTNTVPGLGTGHF